MSRLVVGGGKGDAVLDGDLVGVGRDGDLGGLARVWQPDLDPLSADHDRATAGHPPPDGERAGSCYLDVLKYKPGATALAQARAAGAFTPSHQRYWDAARRAMGDALGTKALIEVLPGHRALPAAALLQAMDHAVSAGVLDPQAMLIEARRGAELLFQIITEREEKASIGLATNLPFSEWGAVFPDPRLVAAIIDRVTCNAHILKTGTQSYRLATSKTPRPARQRTRGPNA